MAVIGLYSISSRDVKFTVVLVVREMPNMYPGITDSIISNAVGGYTATQSGILGGIDNDSVAVRSYLV